MKAFAYPIWQIVDNLSYATNNGVSLKSLMMPITIIANDKIVANTENGKGVVTVPDFCALIFSKKVSPLFYYMCKLSLDSLDAAGISVYDDIDKYETYKDETLIDKFNAYFGLHLKFADDPTKLYGENKSVFKLVGKKEEGLSFSISTDELNTNIGKIVVGMLVGAKTRDKKGFTNKLPFVFSYDNLICPWFWVDSLINASGFSRSDDAYKRYEKVRGVYVSLSRIIDSETKKSLPLKEKDKSDVFAIMKYLMLNFDSLFNADSQNLHNKRVRLYEYILYPLRVYFGQHINRIINMQINRTAESISKIFTSLTPMFLMKNLVTSQLLRTYNSTNDYDLFSAYLKGTFKGPQALGKGVSLEQRDINPSYVGRIGLAAASPGDPGVTFTFSPFVKTYDGYFDKDALEKTKQ